jgi:hypothetical protein
MCIVPRDEEDGRTRCHRRRSRRMLSSPRWRRCWAPCRSARSSNRRADSSTAMRIAIRYGERLQRKNLKKGALESLATGYPSHSFVIDLTEAKTLFINARAPSEPEEKLGECIDHLTRDETDDGEAFVYLLNTPEPAKEASGPQTEENKESSNGEPSTGKGAAPDGNGGPEDHEASDRETGTSPTVRVVTSPIPRAEPVRR